jgi:tetratricopeptide (TPR) repeat protein
MPSPPDREAFLQELLQQSSPDAARQLLLEQKQQVDKDFLKALDHMAFLAHQAGKAEAVLEILRLEKQAASLLGETDEVLRINQLAASLAADSGDLDQARQLLGESLEITGNPQPLDSPGRVWASLSASQLLADLEMQTGDSTRARQFLSEARRRAHAAQSLSAEITATLNLAQASLLTKDTESAHRYALQLGILARQVDPQHTYIPSLPKPEALYSLAETFYYDLEDFSGAGALAEMLRLLAPGQPRAIAFHGFCLLRLQRFKEAVPVWLQAIAIEPDKAWHHFNLASALLSLDRRKEALQAMDEAVRLEPESLRFHLMRGQMLQQIGRHKKAIADFTQVLQLAEGQPEETAATPPRSRIEYERNLPVHDMADIARAGRITSRLALGHINKALADAEHSIRSRDSVDQVSGYVQRGTILLQANRHQEAVAAFSRALELAPDDTSTHLRRADAYLAQGRTDAAINDLAVIAGRNHAPRRAIERLTAILEEHPGHALALKWRGFAWLESWRPSLAVEDLTAALQTLSGDAKLYLWRGLARITFSVQPEEEVWSHSFSLHRCRDAIDDLGRAASLDPSDEQALACYKWLVDLASADRYLFHWIREPAEEACSLFQLVPLARGPVAREGEAHEMAVRRQWARAIESFIAAQKGFLTAGLPAMAARLHQDLADNYLRMNELQLALDHLAQAETAYFVHRNPMTRNLQPDVEAAQERSARTGRDTVAIDLDYYGVYGVGQEAFQQTNRLLKAQALARLGDLEQAVEELGDVDQLLDALVKRLRGEITFNALLAPVQILRDAGRYQQALDCLEKLRPHVNGEEEESLFHSLAGTLQGKLGRFDEAIEHFRRAEELARTSSPDELIIVTLQLASSYYYAHQLDAAIRLLEGVDIEKEARSDREKLFYFIHLGQVLGGLGRPAEALQALLRALAFVEETREDLSQLDLRITWQGNQEWLYQLAVREAILAQDPAAAFDLAERAKTRALVDQLATAGLPLPEAARRTAETLENLARNKELLEHLRLSAVASGSSYVDYELLRELTGIDDHWNALVKKGEGGDELDLDRVERELQTIEGTRQRLGRRIEAARLESLTATSGRALSFAELGALLSPA